MDDEKGGKQPPEGRITITSMPGWTTGPGMADYDSTCERDVFGAYYGEHEAGLIIVFYVDAHTAEITWLGVHPHLQSKGVGGALFERARARAVEKGCRSIRVSVAVEDVADFHAIQREKFYKLRGFQSIDPVRPYDHARPVNWLSLDLAEA